MGAHLGYTPKSMLTPSQAPVPGGMPMAGSAAAAAVAPRASSAAAQTRPSRVCAALRRMPACAGSTSG